MSCEKKVKIPHSAAHMFKSIGKQASINILFASKSNLQLFRMFAICFFIKTDLLPSRIFMCKTFFSLFLVVVVFLCFVHKKYSKHIRNVLHIWVNMHTSGMWWGRVQFPVTIRFKSIEIHAICIRIFYTKHTFFFWRCNHDFFSTSNSNKAEKRETKSCFSISVHEYQSFFRFYATQSHSQTF